MHKLRQVETHFQTTISSTAIFVMLQTLLTMWLYGKVDMTIDQYKPELKLPNYFVLSKSIQF
jgi:hypothetical protein